MLNYYFKRFQLVWIAQKSRIKKAIPDAIKKKTNLKIIDMFYANYYYKYTYK